MSHKTSNGSQADDGDRIVDLPPEIAIDSEPSTEWLTNDDRPLVVIPRGGADEIGRSCYQLQTQFGNYLVDCGLKQGTGGQFPDFRGLESGSIDAVFLTHAHIDHSGALPLIESHGFLSDSAPIICTQPTAALAQILLHDSLKIHREETMNQGTDLQFDKPDVEKVLERLSPIGYSRNKLSDFNQIGGENIWFQFGNAAHLLGSSWISIETAGRSILFSGDIGNRSAHLPELDDPPPSDTLILESTYGDKNTHRSFNDARTEFWNIIVESVKENIPVLVPAFAVGRSQEILQIIKERWRDLPQEIQERFEVIYDGMAQDATNVYHAWGVGEYVNSSINNRRSATGDSEPFLPECAWSPSQRSEREGLLDGDKSPIIIAPAGMLTGGLSPVYLLELVLKYDQANIIFTGYQAEGTPGRKLKAASGVTEEITFQTDPLSDVSGDSRFEVVDDNITVNVPTTWVKSIDGFSAHGARNDLLQWVRKSSPGHIALVHGEPRVQSIFIDYLKNNTTSDYVTQTSIQRPFQVIKEEQGELTEGDPLIDYVESIEGETGIEDINSGAESDFEKELVQRIEKLESALTVLSREILRRNKGPTWTESDLRNLINNELDSKNEDPD